MLEDELLSKHPQLFHMAQAGSWPTIREYGLLTTDEIVSTSGLPSADIEDILTHRRPNSVNVDHPRLGRVVIRDQGPLNEANLMPKLVDLSLSDWQHVLNGRVFFWLHPDKLRQLLNARRYRGEEQDVLTVDTASLLQAHRDAVRLSPINSGATLYPNAPERGHHTFQTIDKYDYSAQKRKRGQTEAIVELAVLGGVPDIREHVVEVARMKGDVVLSTYPL